MKKISIAIIFSIVCTCLFFNNKAFACDTCSPFIVPKSQAMKKGEFRLGLAEQFTAFNKLQMDGKYFENEINQKINSSQTRLLGSYFATSKLGLDLELPYINRSFKRMHDGEVESGTVSGLGDTTIQARYTVYSYNSLNRRGNIQVFAGVKLATGSSSKLAEESEESHEHGKSSVLKHEEHEHGEEHEEEPDMHSEEANAIHGHDLALGSGSYDFPIGASFYSQSSKFLFLGNIQYQIRTRGDYSFKYANDLTYRLGSAYYLAQNHDYTLALGFNISGENKGIDTGADGFRHESTGRDAVYAGPQIQTTIGESFAGDASFDVPLDIRNTGLQAVPGYRFRLGLSYFF